MSINLIRSPRKTEFWRVNTPNTVGPGSYKPLYEDPDEHKERDK
jgi:hypothetical protein